MCQESQSRQSLRSPGAFSGAALALLLHASAAPRAAAAAEGGCDPAALSPEFAPLAADAPLGSLPDGTLLLAGDAVASVRATVSALDRLRGARLPTTPCVGAVVDAGAAGPLARPGWLLVDVQTAVELSDLQSDQGGLKLAPLAAHSLGREVNRQLGDAFAEDASPRRAALAADCLGGAFLAVAEVTADPAQIYRQASDALERYAATSARRRDPKSASEVRVAVVRAGVAKVLSDRIANGGLVGISLADLKQTCDEAVRLHDDGRIKAADLLDDDL